jgi:hypothetical protein
MENPLMRVYIINASDLIVSREAPAEPSEDEIIVGSLEELRAARLSGKRLLALWNGLPGVARLSKVGDRDALVDRLWAALEALPDPQPVRAFQAARGDRIAAPARGGDRRRGEGDDGLATAHSPRVFSGALKKKLGLAVVAAKEERGRVYRIVEPRA